MSLARQSLMAAAAAIVMSVSRLAIVAVLARRLPAAAFGQFVYAQWLVDFAILLCSFGAPAAASRYAAEFAGDTARVGGFLRPWRWWVACSSLAGALAAVAGGWISGLHLGAAGYAVLFLWATTQSAWTAYTAALTGCQRFGAIALLNVGYAATIGVAAWAMPRTVSSAPALFGTMSVAAAAAATAGIVIVARHSMAGAATLDAGQWRSIRSYAGNMWMTALMASLVWSRGEYPLVRALLGDEALARYAAPMTLFGVGIAAVMLAVAGATPYLTELWGRGAHDTIVILARRITSLQLLLCGVVALVLTLFSGELLHLGFGDAYRDPQGILPILSLGLVGLAVSAPNHLLQIATDARFSRTIALAGIVMLFPSTIVAVLALGLPGAALARALTMIAVAVVTGLTAGVRWGPRIVPLRNAAMTVVTVVLALVLVAGNHDLGVFPRIGALAAGVLALGITLRGESGNLVAGAALRHLRLQRASVVPSTAG